MYLIEFSCLIFNLSHGLLEQFHLVKLLMFQDKTGLFSFIFHRFESIIIFYNLRVSHFPILILSLAAKTG